MVPEQWYCVSQKNPTPKAHAPLMSIKMGYPMHLVAVDIAGLFPKSLTCNTHILMVAYIITTSPARLKHVYSQTRKQALWQVSWLTIYCSICPEPAHYIPARWATSTLNHTSLLKLLEVHYSKRNEKHQLQHLVSYNKKPSSLIGIKRQLLYCSGDFQLVNQAPLFT